MSNAQIAFYTKFRYINMLLIKVLVCWSMIINLTLASKECTADTPWNCDHGGINVTLNDKLIMELIEPKKGISREFDVGDVEDSMNVIKHKKQKIPEFFDSRIKWPMCRSLFRIHNQRSCGTCWAFASTSLTSDRLCIATKGRLQYDLSQQDIITCCKKCFPGRLYSRCRTASSLVAPLMYIIKYGVTSADCKPYDVTTVEDGCKQYCVDDRMYYNKYRFNISFLVVALVKADRPTSTLEDVQIEIMKYGSVGSRLQYTPESFKRGYTDQVYINPDPNPINSGHAVKIIGWGIENKVPYWLCANSWGTRWGQLGGFYKIRREANELGIEQYFLAVDTAPENRPKFTDFSSAMSLVKTLQMYKITIIVVNFLNS